MDFKDVIRKFNEYIFNCFRIFCSYAVKYRPSKKLGLIIISAFLLLVILFALFLAHEILGFAKQKTTVPVVIRSGDTILETSYILKSNDIIRHPLLFRLYSRLFFSHYKILTGTHTINKHSGYKEILIKLGQKSESQVTIPEGFEFRQIAELLFSRSLIDIAKFKDLAQNYPFDYEFVKQIPKRQNRLEGYLFPDSYEFYKGEGELSILNKMLENFNQKVAVEYFSAPKPNNLTFDNIITLSSLIEREAKFDEDRAVISSVFYNRLNSTTYPYLQSCASVQYILGVRKEILSLSDTKINSPYNTYINKGLPIGPIASAGIKSIKAALYPDKTDYYFFVAGKDGKHIFSKTYQQHLIAVKKAESK